MSSLVWCNRKSQAAESYGPSWPSQRKFDLKNFRREKPITHKRPWTNPELSRQPHNTSELKDHHSSTCSAAPKSGHFPTVGKQSTTFRRKLWRNTVQLNIDSHGPIYRQTELISKMERNICLRIKTKYRSLSSSSAAFQWKPEGCHDGKILVF